MPSSYPGHYEGLSPYSLSSVLLSSGWVDWPLELAETPKASSWVAMAELEQEGCCGISGLQPCEHWIGSLDAWGLTQSLH